MLKVLDLFSGIGGISLGLERTGGFRTVAFCEIDKAATKVLNKHWPTVPVFNDVSTLKGSDIGAVDVIAGGFPCQDISVAGNGAGLEGERSGLWWEFHRLIKEIKPKVVIAENVAALRSRGLDQVLRSLSEIGYDAEWHCIPASAVGAPHQRDRIWIVAYPNSTVSGGRTIAGHASDEGRGGSTARGEVVQPKDRQTCSNNIEQGCETLAYPNDFRCSGSQNSQSNHQGDDRDSPRSHITSESEGSGTLGENLRGGEAEAVSDTIIKGREGWLYRWSNKRWESQLGYLGRCRSMDGQPIEDWWTVEPPVGRVANGVSGRTHRLKQLGNAVVPQIPEIIGMAILEVMCE